MPATLDGGGIYNNHSGGNTVTLTSVTFTNNTRRR